ncbi:concanavalin A-like lectin/glucanase domain-containing protein [Lophiotrema nucula]|uniref:Concanavalin A-like lectin/glucanase domain-containing protein n=1 Tax=Lophiotrema nucula TaxID=690887 RepID=A0A6A5ZJ53_9PLEO|nr:concanavalin A-like lectin/glucanase domain-containing protein [Lophiotrema nucula]
MSGTFNKLLEKGKAKVKEYSTPSNQGYPGQGQQGQAPHGFNQYPHAPYPQQYPQQPYPPSPYNNAPPPNQYPQYPSYNVPPPQNSPYGPPPQNWGPPPPNQWAQPQQQLSPPPIPPNKPNSPAPPPVPSNRPLSGPSTNNLAPPYHPTPQQPPDEKVYWRPSFDQATPVAHNFRHELGAHGWGNNESQNYIASPQNSFHTPDGRLVVRAISQNGTYTSARLTSHQTLSRPRGYLTATVYPPCAEGIWPAFWMLPKDPFQWPTDGEIDIFENWNADSKNHSCLHWGAYNGEDWNKHRVIETLMPSMYQQPHTFGVAWIEEDGIPNWRGRLIWYIDGRPVMKGNIPQGTRRMEDFRILINVAMGGTVCGGKLPRDGQYDMVVSDLKMCEEPVGGWHQFERDWEGAPEGKPM